MRQDYQFIHVALYNKNPLLVQLEHQFLYCIPLQAYAEMHPAFNQHQVLWTEMQETPGCVMYGTLDPVQNSPSVVIVLYLKW